MHEITNAKQLADVLTRETRLVVVDCFATWCGPCRALTPHLERIANEYPKAVFVKVDVDKVPSVCDDFSVTAMPTLLFLKAGKLMHRVVGADLAAIQAAVKKHM